MSIDAVLIFTGLLLQMVPIVIFSLLQRRDIKEQKEFAIRVQDLERRERNLAEVMKKVREKEVTNDLAREDSGGSLE